jgi:CHAD domain-containing protein
MRVALRRFRAAARVFGKAVDRVIGEPVVDQLAADAAAVAGPLGRARDLDVFIAYLQREAEAFAGPDTAADSVPEGARGPWRQADVAPIERLIERRRGERAAASTAARAALDGPAMQRLRDTVTPRLAPVAAASQQAKGKRRTVGRCAPKLVARRLRRLRRLDDTLTVPRPEDLHRVRIRAKQLRYTAELFVPAFAEMLSPVVELATHIQDTLGVIHDLDVFGAALLEDVEQVAQEPATAADAASIARLIRRGHVQHDEALARFRTLWEALPKPGALRKQIERNGS